MKRITIYQNLFFHGILFSSKNTNWPGLKKSLTILILLVCSFRISSAQSIPAGCCPEFQLVSSPVTPCDDNACKENSPTGGGSPLNGQSLSIACKNQPQTYYVSPALPGFTYSWTITGGTPTSTSGNPATITWGNAQFGYLQVIVSNGTCRDTIRRKICLLDAPLANISFSPNPVCQNTPVNFSGSGSVGATTYYWDFGDGTYSNLQNPPPHIYSSPGNYNVILTVSNTAVGGSSAGQPRDCGCKDTAMVKVVVQNKPGLQITTTDCRKMLCTGDTVIYCANTTGCSGIVWNISGGQVIAGQGTSCATVVWNQPSTYPTTVSVSTTSCPSSICGNSATLHVPVLYPNLPIQGPLNVCPSSITTYTLPALPGTFYQWTLSGGGSIATEDSNHNIININWNALPGGPYKLICRYTNPYSKCSGADTIDIFIKPKFRLVGPSPMCVGQSATYCANGPVATWSYLPATGFAATPSGASCQNILWNSANNYTISATPLVPANFCSSPAVLNVIVNDTPSISNISGPTIVCAGVNAMYSISSNMGGAPFTWTVTGGSVVQYYGAKKDSALISFTGSGTITVFQVVNGCSSKIKTLNVTAITSLAAITGPVNVCMDDTTTYTIPGAVPPGGYTWTLNNPLGTIISQTANTVTIVWSGSVSIGTFPCILTASACSATTTLTINVKTPANGTITASGNLCTTGVTLTASIPGGPSTYDWYRNGLPHMIGGPASINVTLPGFYKVIGKTGCFGKATINVPNTFTSSVTISTGDLTTICPGNPVNVTMVATVQSNNTCTYIYQWFQGVTPVGSNSPTYTATALGNYTVVITCGNCTATSNTIVISQGPCNGVCGLDNTPLRKMIDNIGGPASVESEEEEERPLAYSIVINPPVASPCNVVTFSANYNFTTPHTPNSGVFWYFGDGFAATSSYSGLSGTSTAAPHVYTQPGIYIITAVMYANCPPPPTPHICPVVDTIRYTVPIAANFGYNVNCNTITLSDLSSTLPSLGCSITSWNWSVVGPAGATFNNNTLQNPILTTTQSGVYNVTLNVTSSCGGCSASITYPITITAPSASFTAPTTVCAGTPISFTTAGTPGYSYNWNFGNGYQSNLQNTSHTFAAPPPSSTNVTLTVTNALGCTATASQTINILPPLTVSIPSTKFICPGGSYTIVTTPAAFGSYQWYFNGAPISGATAATYTATVPGEYYVIVSNGTVCVAKSNKLKLWLYPLPIADIQGQSVQCLFGGSGTLSVSNSVNDPNYTYSWTVTPAATFTPNNTQFFASVNVSSPGVYQFILTVTDTSTNCVARDTFCVWAYNSPTVTIAPTGYFCEGVPHTFVATASPANPNYVYQWNNGVANDSMTTAQAGTYWVTVFDPATGCFGQSTPVTIKKRPYVALFPIGCDTLCDTSRIIPPLPLFAGQTYNSVYNIQWFVNGTYHSTGPLLNLNSLPLGNHVIEILVNFLGDTCAARSGKYFVHVKHCGDCNCKGSKWDNITLGEGELPPQDKEAKAANIKNNVGVGGGNVLKLECKGTYTLKCKQTYNINASFNCPDTACPPKVTYKLVLPDASVQTGNVPFAFTPVLPGVYQLTLYGWCGNKICDSCVVTFKVECEECDCKGSKWVEKLVTINNQTSTFDCKKTYDVKCKQPITLNAVYQCAKQECNGDVTYSLTDPNGSQQTGNLPLTFIPNITGTYTVVMYGWCGTVICDSCVVYFRTKCVPDSNCCPYEIKVEPKPPVYTSTNSPASTIVTTNFAITIPAIANITEVKANVVSYTIDDNFKKECMQCVNLPFTWASIAGANSINTAPPKITMYGGSTVPTFNGTGAGAYQNPREVVWNNGSNLNSPNISNIGMSFILPPTPNIDCCELKGRICVKFIFRDNDCKECEAIACFEFVIKKK